MRTENDFRNYLDTIKKIAAEEGYDSLDETYVKHLECRFFGREVVIGRTGRITLRELKKEDLEAIYAFHDAEDEAVLQAFLKESPAESGEHLECYIRHMYPLFDYGIWAVVKNDTGELIGLCGMGNPVIDGAQYTDLGYYICSKYRKQGYAAESIEIVLDYAKNYLEIPLICAIIKEENRISKGILQKFGFEAIRQWEDSGKKFFLYQKELKGWGKCNE